MKNKNSIIEKQLDVVKQKREILISKHKEIKNYDYKTNLNFSFLNFEKNLIVLKTSDLKILLNLLTLLDKNNEINGFLIDEWIDDINILIQQTVIRNTLNQLDEIEKSLQKKFSNDKKDELELNNLMNTFKNL